MNQSYYNYHTLYDSNELEHLYDENFVREFKHKFSMNEFKKEFGELIRHELKGQQLTIEVDEYCPLIFHHLRKIQGIELQDIFK
jgi:hypothetical protein